MALGAIIVPESIWVTPEAERFKPLGEKAVYRHGCACNRLRWTITEPETTIDEPVAVQSAPQPAH